MKKSPAKKDDTLVWQSNLQNLKKFKKEHNHCNVPENFEKDPQLARWVKNVRTHRSKLPQWVDKALLKLKFDFNYKPSSWDLYYEQLKAFYKTNGHVYIQYRDTAYASLYQWTRAIRQSRAKLSQAQRDSLDNLGFEWETQNRNKLWELRLRELADFKKKHGHIIIPKSLKNLNGWVRGLRKKQRSISKERKEQLAALGFLWSSDVEKAREQAWEKRYSELLSFYKEHGHTRVPQKTKLGMWCNSLLKPGKYINEERKKKLSNIGFGWEGNRLQAWNECYRELALFKKKHGHTRVPASMKKLHNWASSQRKTKHHLTKEQVNRLDELDFLWAGDFKKLQWETQFQELVKFKKRHGHTFVNASMETLYKWCLALRQKKNRLSAQQQQRLTKIGFHWGKDVWREWRWHQQFNQLKALYKKSGHCKVPREEAKLYAFLSRQKKRWKQGVLKPERKKMLMTIGIKLK